MAFGLAVVERGMVGLFDIVTAPAWRGRGLARRLASGLLAWGHGHGHGQGARRASLQVAARNPAALALYGGLGFEECHGYDYWAPVPA